MGWGQEPREGWADEKLPDGRWVGPTHSGGDPDPLAVQAVCGCEWRSQREHPVPPRPANLPYDDRGLPCGPDYDAWIAAREAADNACWEDWNAEHYQAPLGHEPHTQLILGRSDGGPRHCLDGEPVHAGSTLELPTGGSASGPYPSRCCCSESSPPAMSPLKRSRAAFGVCQGFAGAARSRAWRCLRRSSRSLTGGLIPDSVG